MATRRPNRPLRVLYFGTWRDEYSRNRIQIAALRRAGVEVIECHASLWKSVEDRVQAVSGGWAKPGFLLRLITTYLRLIIRYMRMDHDYDLIVCGYPGQFDVYLAWLISRIEGKPLVWDVFMSTWLVARERGLESRSSLSVSALYAVEWLALRLPDRLVQDTKQYADWFSANFGVPFSRFGLVPTGADSDLFAATTDTPTHRRTDALFTVLYYGSYIPNHDAPTIVRAAALLRDRTEIRFVMIGDGPQRAECVAEAQRLALANVRFVDWLTQDDLKREIANADLCLGAFGNTPQSRMTVQNKIFECLAMGKPVLTGASDAIADAMVVGEEIAVCARRNPQAIADAIVALHADPAYLARLAEGGAARFQRDYTIAALGQTYAAILRAEVGERAAGKGGD